MNKIGQITKNLGGVISKNSPHILTGIGCAGVVSTAVLAVKATPKATIILEKEEEYRERKRLQSLTKMEKVKLTWKCYIPAGVMGATTIGCIIGANTVNMRRNAALASLYALSESAFREYKTKVVEEIGKPKETKIRDEIAKDRITNNPQTPSNVVVVGAGEILCYDKLSDRYFKSTHENIRKAFNDLAYDLRSEMRLDLNELYTTLGLAPNGLGSMVEFDIEKGPVELITSTQLDQNGQPCLVIDYDVYPKYTSKY